MSNVAYMTERIVDVDYELKEKWDLDLYEVASEGFERD